jgi:hypothetical protein
MAEKLKISVRRVHELCRKEKLEYVDICRKDRRFTPPMLDKYVSSRTISKEPDKLKWDQRKITPPYKKGGLANTEESGSCDIMKEIEGLCR